PRSSLSRALREDALAVPGVVLAVPREELVTVRAVVPARVVEGLGLGARGAALGLSQLGRRGRAAVGAGEHVRHGRSLIASRRCSALSFIMTSSSFRCSSRRIVILVILPPPRAYSVSSIELLSRLSRCLYKWHGVRCRCQQKRNECSQR